MAIILLFCHFVTCLTLFFTQEAYGKRKRLSDRYLKKRHRLQTGLLSMKKRSVPSSASRSNSFKMGIKKHSVFPEPVPVVITAFSCIEVKTLMASS